MLKQLGFAYLILIPLCVHATKEDQLKLAEAYYEAKVYPESLNIYQELLEGNLTSWERSVVLYNIGTLLTSDTQYDQAVEDFQKIPLESDTSPLLKARLKKNLSIANFRHGQLLMNEIRQNPSSSQDLYFKLQYFYKQALEGLLSAQKDECQLLQIIGEESCPENKNLKKLAALTKENIALMHTDARDNLVNHANPRQGLPWLLTGLQLLENDIDFLLEKQLSPQLKKKYQNLLQSNVESWGPLWQAVRDKLRNDPKKIPAFEEADHNNHQLLDAVQRGEFNEAQTHLKTTVTALNSLMRQLFAADSFYEVMSKLFNDFSLAALQDPLEATTLLFLQKELSEITVPVERSVIDVGIKAIKDNLDQSLLAVEKHQLLLSQMYFYEALQQIRRILLLLDPNVLEHPDLILEAGIQEQRHALMQTRSLSSMQENQQNYPHTAVAFVRTAQEYLLKFSEFFYISAYNRQTKEFNQPPSEQGEDMRCQYHPWNEVFPLFQEGFVNATRAARILKNGRMDLNAAMNEQNHVIETWNKVLKIMREPKKSGGCHSSSLSQVEQSQSPESSFEDLSRLIQQMNYDDQKPKQPIRAIKEGLFSW